MKTAELLRLLFQTFFKTVEEIVETGNAASRVVPEVNGMAGMSFYNLVELTGAGVQLRL